jgi:hypothetical protein
MLFGKKKREQEKKEALQLEKILLEVIKQDKRKEQAVIDLEKKLEAEFKDFPVHRLIHILIRKNVIQMKDLDPDKKP